MQLHVPGLLAKLLLVGSLVAQGAMANVITLEARDFAYGTNLSTVAFGLTMRALVNTSRISYAPVYRDVYADPYSDAGYYEPGTGAFYYDPDFPDASDAFGSLKDFLACRGSGSDCGTAIAVLELSFSDPLDYLMVGGNDPADVLGFIGFDAAGNVTANCLLGALPSDCSYSQDGDGFNYRVTLNSIDGNVSRVWAAFDPALGSINLVSYSLSVPAPGAFGLFLGGLVGLGLTRRRKATDAN